MRNGNDGSAMLALQVGIGVALVAIGLTAWSERRTATTRRRLRPMRDYSDRSGFPLGLEASRGAAKDALIPKDMLQPAALRPFTTATASL
jgi:hypothetical protein